jgi:multidrug efflux pump subunit AcrB
MIRFFAGHPTIANLLMILFLAAGLSVSPGLLRETFPRKELSEVEISVPYPGARPEDVESAICERIENALDAVTGIERHSCEAREGLARAVVEMRQGNDFQAFVADIKSEIDTITDFPERAETARVKALGLTDFVASVAITGPSTRPELKDYAENVRTRMLRWGGIPKVDIGGFSTLQLRIDLRPEALKKFGVSVSDIARAVAASSLDLPAGNLETSSETLLIRIAEERQSADAGLVWVRENLVVPLADLAIRWRYGVAGLTVAIFLISLSMIAGGFLKFTAFPELDGDTIVARVLLPQGTPLARTEQVVARLEDGLARVNAKLSPDQPDGAELIRHVSVFYGLNRDAFETGAHVATISVDLLPSAQRSSRPDAIMQLWREIVGQVPDVISLKYAESTIGPAGIAIDMRLKGDDLTQLKSASIELRDWIWQYRGVTSVLDDLRPGKRELRVTLKKTAGPMGITANMVAEQMRAAYFGTTISEMQVDGSIVEVTARLGLNDYDSFRAFDDFIVTGRDGANIPISVVADIETGRGVSRINRQNASRTVTVQGTIDTRIANANAIVNDVMARFAPDFLARHPGISLSVEGQNAEASITQKSMLKGFLIGLIGVFLLLSFLFRSYIEPIIVMLIIPLSLSGSIFGHMAMGLNFSMPSMLGFVALAGVVVNNSILLVDFIKNENDGTLPPATAASRAVRARFRAVFLTPSVAVASRSEPAPHRWPPWHPHRAVGVCRAATDHPGG